MSILTSIKAWLGQTSTKGALVGIAGIAGAVATHAITRDAAVATALPLVLGLIIDDVATVKSVAAEVTPALQAIADKPTLATIKSEAAAVVAPVVTAELPTVLAAVASPAV